MANFIYRPLMRILTGKLDLKEVLRPYAEYARLEKEKQYTVAEETELVSSVVSNLKKGKI